MSDEKPDAAGFSPDPLPGFTLPSTMTTPPGQIVLRRDTQSPPVPVVPCPAWADGLHCFAMEVGGGWEFGYFHHLDKPKRCACGAVVERTAVKP